MDETEITQLEAPVREELEELFLKLQGADADWQDWERFEALTSRDPAAAAYAERLAKVWQRLDPLSPRERARLMRGTDSIGAPPPATASRLRTSARRLLLPLAAAMALMAVGLGAWWFLPGVGVEQTVYGNGRYVTAVGEIKSLTLEDGSVVTLGAESSLSVRFGRDRRDILLEDGFAHFVVAHDPRPFAVSAGVIEATALGTRFDVSRAPLAARVAVAEGAVGVRLKGPSLDDEIPLRRLSAGEQILVPVRDRSAPVVERIDPRAPGSWRAGRLTYVDVPLGDVVSEIDRFFAGRIRIDNPAVAHRRVTASLRLDDPSRLLEELAKALDLRLQQDGDVIRVLPGDDEAGQKSS